MTTSDTTAVPEGEFPIGLTPTAIEKAREILEAEKTGTGIRIAVTSGGCSGFSYEMKTDAEARDDDVVYDQGGVRVVVDRESLEVLRGTTLDYSASLTREGFKFVNPNATRTCGCGESFGV